MPVMIDPGTVSERCPNVKSAQPAKSLLGCVSAKKRITGALTVSVRLQGRIVCVQVQRMYLQSYNTLLRCGVGSECPFCMLSAGRPSSCETLGALHPILYRYVQVSAGEVLAQSMMALLPGIDANDEHKAQSVFHFYVVAFSSLPVIEVSQQHTPFCQPLRSTLVVYVWDSQHTHFRA